MTEKEKLYLTLTERMQARQDYDEWLMDNQPATWSLARIIDDWLLQYRDNPQVGPQQYQRNCARLWAIYDPAQDVQGAA